MTHHNLINKKYLYVLPISLFLLSITSPILLISTPINKQSSFYPIGELLTDSKNLSLSQKLNFNDPLEMENLLDSIVLDEMEPYNLVGVTVSVVLNNSLFLSKGYGYSNYSSLTPVDPINTLFRVGSISKTFVAISILQLMEDGMIDLDEDVNNYLSAFQIADTYPEPITIRNLLTHTAGFEETVAQAVFEEYSEMPNLEETLTTGAPQRVNPPGEVVSYSNYGFTLLGYIVEELTGLTLAQYVQMEILDPFGMNHTTFEQPLPVQLESDMSVGYWEERETGYFEYLSIAPAAALTSSAGDIAKFMIAMMNNASYNGNQILENSTVEMMESEQFITYPGLPSMCFGLYEMNMNDEYIIGHGGDTVFFHSNMALFPDYNLGLFISYNNREGLYAKYDFINHFINYYFPYENDNIVPMEGYNKNLNDFAGFYLSSRRHYTDAPGIPKDAWMSVSSLQFVSTGQYLRLYGYSIEFVQTAPNYFVEKTGQYDFIVVFFKDEEGRVTHFHSNLVGPTETLEKVHFLYRHFSTFNAIVISFAVIFLLSLVYWGTKGVYNFLKKSQKTQNLDTLIKWWITGIPASFISYAVYLNAKAETIIFLEKEVPEIFGYMFILPLLTFIFVIGLIILTAISWSNFRLSSIRQKKLENFPDVISQEESSNNITENSKEILKEENKFFKMIKNIYNKLNNLQPLLYRIHYTILVILGLSLIIIFDSWGLLNFL